MIANSTQLVQAAQRGDTKSVTQLYMATYKSAYLATKSIVQNQKDAEALVKDSYLEAFYNINTIPDVSRFDKWFNTIVDRKSKEYLLKKNSAIFPQSINAAASFWNDENVLPQAMVAPNLSDSAMNIIYALPENQKLILIMYYNQQLSVAEIAQTLSVSADEVKGTLFNAKQAVERGIAAINPSGATTAAVISATLNRAAQTCVVPPGQIAEIINTLTGGSAPAQQAPVAPVTRPMQNVQPMQNNAAMPNTQPMQNNTAVPNTQPMQNNAAMPNTQPMQNSTAVPNAQPMSYPDASTEQYSQPAVSDPVINGTPQNAAVAKKGISKGAKLALIIGGAAVLVIAAVIVVAIIMFSNQNSADVVSTQPATTAANEPTEAESQTETINTNSGADDNKLYDNSYALPASYKYQLASFDKKNGFDSGLGIDEKDTIKQFEELPEIKKIMSDKDAYVRLRVTQSVEGSREIYNYYGGDDIAYVLFINTSERGCQVPNRFNLIFNASSDATLADLRATAKKFLALTKLDDTAVNALLYSDMSELSTIEAADNLGNVYFSNSISEDSLSISVSFYPGYNDETPEGIKAKYYDDDMSKYLDANKVFNNPDIDFNKDLTSQGLSKLTSVDYAKKIANEYYMPSISYTTDQNGKTTDIEYSISDDFELESKDGKISEVEVSASYSEDSWGGPNGEISFEYSDGSECLGDCAKLALEQFKFFDKDFSLSEKELKLSDDDDSKELDVKTKLSPNGKATLEIENDGSNVTYTLSWESDED